MQTITLSFDRRSRALTADFDGAGTVIDDMAVVFAIAPIEGAVIEMVFGVLIRDGSRSFLAGWQTHTKKPGPRGMHRGNPTD